MRYLVLIETPETLDKDKVQQALEQTVPGETYLVPTPPLTEPVSVLSVSLASCLFKFVKCTTCGKTFIAHMPAHSDTMEFIGACSCPDGGYEDVPDPVLIKS
jgi:hypothetical protein